MAYINQIPSWLTQHQFSYDPANLPPPLTDRLRAALARFRNVVNPDVSIIIPAYNEEASLLNVLSSLAAQQTQLRVELIVSNNNSKDRTQALLEAVGVQSLLVTQQGAGFARQAALTAARGQFLINADADCLYPPTWIDALVAPLRHAAVSCTYGTYSFLPSAQLPRPLLWIHETAARSVFALRRWRGYECVNVMGFNFACRRADALAVGGFNTSFRRGIDAASDDGWMALCLQQRGTLQHVVSGAHVWSSNRLLVNEGGFLRAFGKRTYQELRRLKRYVRPATLPTPS